MISPLAHQAETQRLARVLDVAPHELSFLQDAPVEALAELRGAVLDRLLERSRREFERAVALADRIPRGLAATLTQKAMGPVLGGRAAALISADLATPLPAAFLADVATHVDLRHVGPLIGGIPTQTMAGARAVLRTREEWIVLSAFVGHVPEAKLEDLLEGFDGEALLRAGFVIEDVDRLDPVVALLADHRLDELLQAAHEHDLWTAAIALAVHLGPEQRARVVGAIERRPPEHLDRLLVVTGEEGLWTEIVAVAAHVGPQGGGGIIDAIGRLDADQASALAAVLRDDPALRADVAPRMAQARSSSRS